MKRVCGLRRAVAAGLLLGCCAAASGQTAYTNDVTGNVTDLWGVAANWLPATVPGHDGIGGDSNDIAWVNFVSASGTVAPRLNLFGSNYVLNALVFTETTNSGREADGNFISRTNGSFAAAASLTIESLLYALGGREIDFQPEISIIDKVDGRALLITNTATLDLGGPVMGTEGLRIEHGATIFFRNYQMGYGVDPTNGLTFGGIAGGSKRFALDASAGNVTHDIPNLAIEHSGVMNLTFLNASPSNVVTVNVSNLALGPATIDFRPGAESRPDGSAASVLNINGQVSFANATNSADRNINLQSAFGGVVNFNSNIVVNQDLDSTRTLNFNGDGVLNLRANTIMTNGELFTRNVAIDGNRGLVVSVDNPDALGASRLSLGGGSILRMNYDVFGSFSNGFGGYPGSNLVYGANEGTFLDFNAAQSGFFDPRFNVASSALVVRAFNGIAGDLSGATYTGAGANILFQTNAVVSEAAANQPTLAQVGRILWLGITNAGGTYVNVGDPTTPYRGVALSALALPGGDADLLTSTTPGATNQEISTTLSGFHAKLTAAPGQDLEMLLAQQSGVSFGIMPMDQTNRAEFNSDTGVAYVRGVGTLLFQPRNTWDTWGGTVTNLVRIGLDGVFSDENPLGLQQQNSIVVDMNGANAFPSNKILTVINGQARMRGGDNLGAVTGTTNATLVVGSGASLLPDDGQTAAATITVNRGRIIFQDDGALYTGVQVDSFNFDAGRRTNMVFSPQSIFVINDASSGTGASAGWRSLATDGYSFALSNMNVVLGDDAMRTATVQTASSFALNNDRRLTTAANSDGNLDRLIVGANSNVAVTAAAGATQVLFTAATGRSLNIRTDVLLTNTTLIVNNTNRFITVLDDTTTRSNAFQTGAVNLLGLTNRLQDVNMLAGTNSIAGNLVSARDVSVTNGSFTVLALQSDFRDLTLGSGPLVFSNRTATAAFANVSSAGTLTLGALTNTMAGLTVRDGTTTIGGNFSSGTGALYATNTGTATLSVLSSNAFFRDVTAYANVTFNNNTTLNLGDVESLGRGRSVQILGADNAVSNLTAANGGDFIFGNARNDKTRVYGDVVVNEGLDDSTAVSFANGTNEIYGNILWNTITNQNTSGTSTFLGTPTLTLYGDYNHVFGSVYIGPTNPIDGVLGGSGRIVVGNDPWDTTVIDGDIVIDAPRQPSNNAQLFSRGDLVISNDVILNFSRINYEDVNLTNQYNYGGARLQIEAVFDTNRSDGIGLYDRLRDGTLVRGPNGIEVRDFASLYLTIPTTNDLYTIGQKITVDQQDAHYWYVDGRSIEITAQTNLIGGVNYGAFPAKVDLTNIWLRDGSFLRVDEAAVGGVNATNAPTVRLGIAITGATTNGRAYMSDSSNAGSDPVDLLDVRSGNPGIAKVLQIGTTNGRVDGRFPTNQLDDIPFTNILYGTVSSDVTLDVFNGNLSMTNGAAILGAAQVSRDGSIFNILAGTTGYVANVNMVAGMFSNRGDLMSFDNVTVSGGQGILDGQMSYATNFTLNGGTGIVASAGARFGQVTFDGGALRSVTNNYVLAAEQGVRVTNIANGGVGTVIVDAGLTMTISNAVDGDGTLAKAGAGILILSNANQQAGTSVRQGTLLYSANNRLRTDAGGTLAVEGGVLDLNGFNQDSAGSVRFLGGLTTNGTITKAGADFDAQAGEVAATLQGTAGLTKTGAGTAILSGSNAYQGATTVAGGSLRLDSANALPGGVATTSGTSLLVLTNGGVLGLGIENFTRNLGTDVSNVTWTGSGGFAAYGADRRVNIGGQTQTLTWGQANFVSGGNELVFGASDATHTLIFENSIDLAGTDRFFRANQGAASVDGRITGDVTGDGGVIKTGEGTLEFAGNNTYTGTTEVAGGVLLFGSAGAMSGNSLLAISNFGAIGLGAGNFTRSLGTNGGDVVWTGSGGFAAYGADRTVNIGGALAQLTWGSNFFVPEIVDGSVLVLGASGASHTVELQNDIDMGASNRTVFAGNGDASVDAILSGVLTGSGGLTKAGSGVLLLSNTNQFTGGLGVRDGRLVLAGGDNRLQAQGAVLGSSNGNTSGILQLGDSIGRSDQTLAGLVVEGSGANNRVVGGATAVSTLTLDLAAGVTNEYSGFLGGPGLNENNLALLKTNDGALFLSGGNTYTGRTTITGGVIAIGVDSALGGDPGSFSANQLTLDGGILRATNTFGIIANRGITLGAGGGTIEVDGTRQLTNNAVVTGTGGLTKTGNGVLQLASNSTYSGATVVAGGILRLNAANSVPGGVGAAGGTSGITLTNGGVIGLAAGNFLRGLGAGADQIQWTGDGGFAAYHSSRTVTIANSAAFQLVWGANGFVPDGSRLILSSTDSTNQITLANNIDLGAVMRTVHVENAPVTATDGVLSGIISGAESGGLLKTGAGRLYLSNAGNTYTGKTVIAAGSIVFNVEANFGANPTVFAADQMTIDGGSLVANANDIVFDDPNRGFTFGPSNASIEVGSSLARVMTINNVIAGPGTLSKVGVGILRLNAANTFTGRTDVSGRGFVWISNENALGAAPESFVSNQLTLNGGGLRVTNDVIIDDPNRGITIAGSSTVWVDSASSLAVSNVIAGSGALNKWGVGLLALSASNIYTGVTTIREGTLALASETALGGAPAAYQAAQLIITNGATLRATESFTINNNNRGVRLDLGTNGGGVFDVDPGVTLDISNHITGAGGLVKIGAGTLLLNNTTNFYGGGFVSNSPTAWTTSRTVIAAGTLGLRAEQALGTNVSYLLADRLIISNGGVLRALASFAIDDPSRGITLGVGGGGFEADPGITLSISNNVLGGTTLFKSGSGAVSVYGLSNVLGGVSATGGTLNLGGSNLSITRITGDVVANDVATNATVVSFNNGFNEVFGSIYFNPTSNSNLISGAAFAPTLNLLAETTIVYGSVFIGVTNAGEGSGHIVVGNAASDYTEIRGDLVLDAPDSNSSTRQIMSRGDGVIFSNVIVNASGVNPLAQAGGARGEAANFFIEGDFDTNYTDAVGFGSRMLNGTLALGEDGIVIKPYGSMRLDLARTNLAYTIGQRITIDNAGAAAYGFDDRVLEFVTDTNVFYGLPGTGSASFDVTNVVMRDGSYMRVNESASEVRLGLTLEGTNNGSTVFLSDSTGGNAEPFDLLFVRSSVGGEAHTVQVGTTNARIRDDLGLTTVLLGTSSADIAFHVLNGSLIVTNGQGNILGTGRAAGGATHSAEIALVAPSNSGTVGISGIAGRYEVGDFGRLRIVLPRTNAMFVIDQSIYVSNSGPAYYDAGYSAPIAIDRNDGEAVGTTIAALTNVTVGSGSHLRVQETIDDGGMVAVLGLTLEGNAVMSHGNTHESDDFDLYDVRSSVAGAARTLQVGATGLGETRLLSGLYGTAGTNITFDILNGRLTVVSNFLAVGDVQGSVIVHAGSEFQIGEDGLGNEAILNLTGDGTVIGNVTVSNTLSPGFGAGTLSVTGDVTFVPSSIWEFDLDGTSTNVGGGFNDLLQLLGGGSDLSLDGELRVFDLGANSFLGRTTNDYWTIGLYGGSLLNSNMALNGLFLPALDPGLTWMLDTSIGGEVRLAIVIPEPDAWVLVLLGLGLGGTLFAARRRRPASGA